MVATLISPGCLAYHCRRQYKLVHIRSDKTDKSAAGGKPSYFRSVPAYRPAIVPCAVAASGFFLLGFGHSVFFIGKQFLSPRLSETRFSVRNFYRRRNMPTLHIYQDLFRRGSDNRNKRPIRTVQTTAKVSPIRL